MVDLYNVEVKASVLQLDVLVCSLTAAVDGRPTMFVRDARKLCSLPSCTKVGSVKRVTIG